MRLLTAKWLVQIQHRPAFRLLLQVPYTLCIVIARRLVRLKRLNRMSLRAEQEPLKGVVCLLALGVGDCRGLLIVLAAIFLCLDDLHLKMSVGK